MVITESQGLRMLAAANPFPDLDSVDVDLEQAAYLEDIEHGSDEMVQIQEKKTPRETKRLWRLPRWAIAALAAAVVAVVGLGVATGGEDVASSEDLATAQAFLDARAAGDANAAAGLLAVDATFETPITQDPAQHQALLDWYSVTDHTWDVEPCVADEAVPGEIVCLMEWGNAWSTALNSGPYDGEFRFVVEDGLITSYEHASYSWEEFTGVRERMEAFVSENYFDERLRLWDFSRVPLPKLTPQAIALWEQVTEEFVAAHGG